ncbi:LysM peptidoglycan-binding domain-containing protein [Pseudoduganella sp. RAF19]|uniref:glycoside hydrolase family protein n=2 Tax=unclassified Pseudoduganella TaxID=2637179 RepID=UPI003F9814A2
MKAKDTPAEDLASLVRIKLIDPLGNSIEGLKYQIREGSKVVAKGSTDGSGAIGQFASRIGAQLEIYVERFASDGMKQISTLVPWAEKFSVKLASGKVKKTVTSAEHHGDAGDYQRKTHVVKSGDTLSTIAAKNGATAEAIARLNGMQLNEVLSIGRVLKLPVDKPAATPGAAAPPSSKADQTPVPIKIEPARGENGTPKTDANATCDKTGCLKVGDSGPLIEELNIRLFGFGITIVPGKKWNEFTDKTAAAVKQFQRDYMGVPETGNACGGVLQALDEFRTKYPVSVAAMKCVCGKCDGFGHGYATSEKVEMYKNAAKKTPYSGTEYPGIHRALIWGFRAALFYTQTKDADLKYKFLKISSGYRCWHDNKKHSRTSTNHMGNALDLQFTRNGGKERCAGEDIDNLRTKVFIGRMHAQLNWPNQNKLSLEPASLGAKSWVHMDVREFGADWKSSRYYATTQGAADGNPLVEMARSESRFKLVNCAGIPAPPPAGKTDRLAIATLKLSRAGLDFIKDWEKYGDKPYDDSEGYCTIGYGHLIAKKTCATLAQERNSEYEAVKSGVTREDALSILEDDVDTAVQVAKKFAQVPMYQHEFDALVSLAFNAGGLKKFPKLVSKLNTLDYSGCCDEFADITNGGTSGLVKRRQAEMKMFRNNVYDSTH